MSEKIKKQNEAEKIWAVRGVTYEARNAAKMTSGKVNESMGAWLSRVILEAAHSELKGDKKQITRQEDVFNILENLSNKLEKEVSDLRHELNQTKTHKKSWIQIIFNKTS
jgi:septal ring factor EnvC (AmiA/AmiB activator)